MARTAQGSCVVYVRISQDRTGEELGVARQERECRELAARVGLTVEHVYVDNDISATSGAMRPDFEAMIATRPSAIVTWHQDRLLRLTSDLEKVIALEVPVHMVTAGSLDLTTPAGRAVARTVAAWSQYEGEQKAIRQKASNRQAAEHGHWQFSLRPYGYRRTNGRIEQVENEAKLIGDGYRCVLRGESYRAVARRWNRLTERWGLTGFQPVIGDTWSASRVQRMLENPHYAGVVTYRGEEIELPEGRSPQWEPVIDPRTWASFRELKLNRKRARSWAVSPRHLLSGMLVCGVCGGKVFSHAQDKTTRKGAADAGKHRLPVLDKDGVRVKHTTYVCFSKHCVSVRAEYVDALVEEVVVGRLSDERIAKGLRTTEDTAPSEEEIADLQRRRDDVTELLGDGLMSKVKARATLEDLAQRLERAQSRLSAIRAQSPLSDIRLAESIPARWKALPVLDKRRIISDLGLSLTINSANQGKRGIDPDTGQLYSERAWTMLRVAWDWLDK